MHYNWEATLVFLALLIVLTKLLKFVLFRNAAFDDMAHHNKALDKEKMAKSKYPPAVDASNKAGLGTNIVFIALCAPFIMTLQSQVWWLYLVDVAVILLVYDFFYYLMHRFLFHGQSFLRQVHALHHQAREPSHIDAYYVHPLETFMGVALFVATISAYSIMMGGLHAVSAAITYLIFTQLNILNHCRSNLPDSGIFRPVNYITRKHAIHHENMHKGNYATITMAYDYLFGTLD
jgi:sterol desaturase/sphingolipid hydroxylase (fatty acid hydroxylase superfamily)